MCSNQEKSFQLRKSGSISPQLSSILVCGDLVVATGRDDRLDMSFLEGFPNSVTVVPSISNEPFWSGSRSTTTRTFYCDGFECFFEEFNLRRGRRVQVCPQRSTRTIGQYHPLCSLPAFGFARVESPFLQGQSYHRQSIRSIEVCPYPEVE